MTMKTSFALIVCLLFAACLCSCSSNVDLAIDNPTEEPIIVTIDTLMVEVPGREVVWVEMGKGEHQVTLANDSVVRFNFTEEMYMLNPTQTEYLMFEQFYGNQMFMGQHVSTIPKQTVNYLGIELEGNYAVVKGLIVPITWDYGPREALPQTVEIDSEDQYATFVKISDPIELVNELQQSSEAAETEEPAGSDSF